MPERFVLDSSAASSRTPPYMLSSRARRGICFFLVLGVLACLPSKAQTQRPKIFGIASVQLKVSDISKSKAFYSAALELQRYPRRCFVSSDACYWISLHQQLELLPIE